MDLNISGAGSIGPGEYEKIQISGSGRGEGLVRCEELQVSGAFKGEDFECSGEAYVSGSIKVKNFTAKEAHISGAFKSEGDAVITETAKISGSFSCGGSLKCGELRASGATKVGGDIEAERAVISGVTDCPGLVNAEELTVRLDGNGRSYIGSIGGSKITVQKNGSAGLLVKILFGKKNGYLEVAESIEGDEISLENTLAKSVTGRSVVIGEGCRIGKVFYTENAEIDPKAKVGSCEKI